MLIYWQTRWTVSLCARPLSHQNCKFNYFQLVAELAERLVVRWLYNCARLLHKYGIFVWANNNSIYYSNAYVTHTLSIIWDWENKPLSRNFGILFLRIVLLNIYFQNVSGFCVCSRVAVDLVCVCVLM